MSALHGVPSNVPAQRRPRLALTRCAAALIPSTHLMTGRAVPKTPSDLLQGTVDVLILRTLAWEPMHGYAISRWIDEHTDGVIAVDGAPLYQALHRLERRRLIASTWGVSENNRKAKYYKLTTRGRAELRTESAVWRSYADAVGKLLSTG